MDDEVFRALADPNRRQLLDMLNARNGQTLRELCAGLDMARQSVSKHLAVLEAANLVTSVRRGREKWHYLNPAPITELADRWLRRYDRARAQALAELKYALEDTVTRPTFVHTSFIRTTPERLWAALTEPAFTRRYWGMEFETDWTPGENFAIIHPDRGVRIADDRMVVQDYQPFTRLSYTWSGYPKDFTDSLGYDEEFRLTAEAEPRSTVTYELSPSGDQTRLTVTHAGFRPGSVVLPDIERGWPMVLSWLKTYVESGRWREDA